MNNETPRILKPDDDAILKLAEHLPPIKCNILCVHTYRNNVKYDLNLWLDNELEKYTRVYNVDSKFVYAPEEVSAQSTWPWLRNNIQRIYNESGLRPMAMKGAGPEELWKAEGMFLDAVGKFLKENL